jgi:hypothetical protein
MDNFQAGNKAQISPIHQRTCHPLPPEDGRFDPTHSHTLYAYKAYCAPTHTYTHTA